VLSADPSYELGNRVFEFVKVDVGADRVFDANMSHHGVISCGFLMLLALHDREVWRDDPRGTRLRCTIVSASERSGRSCAVSSRQCGDGCGLNSEAFTVSAGECSSTRLLQFRGGE
jgi:hypothetical protein